MLILSIVTLDLAYKLPPTHISHHTTRSPCPPPVTLHIYTPKQSTINTTTFHAYIYLLIIQIIFRYISAISWIFLLCICIFLSHLLLRSLFMFFPLPFLILMTCMYIEIISYASLCNRTYMYIYSYTFNHPYINFLSLFELIIFELYIHIPSVEGWCRTIGSDWCKMEGLTKRP